MLHGVLSHAVCFQNLKFLVPCSLKSNIWLLNNLQLYQGETPLSWPAYNISSSLLLIIFPHHCGWCGYRGIRLVPQSVVSIRFFLIVIFWYSLNVLLIFCWRFLSNTNNLWLSYPVFCLVITMPYLFCSIFSRYGIHSLPSILIVNQRSKVQYRGPKNLQSLAQFYKKTTGRFVFPCQKLCTFLLSSLPISASTIL